MNRCFSLFYSSLSLSLSLYVCVLFETAACTFYIAQTHLSFCDLLFISFIHSHHFKWIYKYEGFPPWDLCGLMALQWLRKTVATARNFKKVLYSKLKLLRGFIHNACQRVQPVSKSMGRTDRHKDWMSFIGLPTSCQNLAFSLFRLCSDNIVDSCFIHMHHSYGTEIDGPPPWLSMPDCSEQHVLIYYGS